MTDEKAPCPWYSAHIGKGLTILAALVGCLGVYINAEVGKTQGAADTLLTGIIDHERRMSHIEGKLGIAGEYPRFAQAEPEEFHPPMTVYQQEDLEAPAYIRDEAVIVVEPPPPPVERGRRSTAPR